MLVVALCLGLSGVATLGCQIGPESSARQSGGDGLGVYRPERPESNESDADGEPEIPEYFPADPGLPSAAWATGPGFLLRANSAQAFVDEWTASLSVIFTSLRQRYPLADSRRRLPIEVCVFESLDAFRTFAETSAPASMHTLGFYDPPKRRVVTADRGLDAPLLATLIHECSHAILRDHAGTMSVPAWLDEGLATYYETGRINGSRIDYGQRHWRFAGIAANLVISRQHASIRELATTGITAFSLADRETREEYYAQAWAWCTWLLTDGAEEHGEVLRAYLETVRGHAAAGHIDRTLRYPRIFEEVLAEHADDLDADFAEWAREELTG